MRRAMPKPCWAPRTSSVFRINRSRVPCSTCVLESLMLDINMNLLLPVNRKVARGLKPAAHHSQPFSAEMRQHAFNHSQQLRMGQPTRSQGISFTHEMWDRIEARCRELKVGRSQYFQMLAEWHQHFMPV